MFLLKSIPKVDKFVQHKAFSAMSAKLITKISKDIIQKLRDDILEEKATSVDENLLIEEVLKKYKEITSPSLQKVINATGVIVHTNLGRSLISPESFDRVKDIVTSYNNLEYDLEKGQRGERYSHISNTLCQLLDCEDVLIVNNNASAVFLVLNTFAKNKEVVVSRGELVEIGGSFRVPDVMASSGAILKEIGTTNKTHLKDYENACNENSAILMKVHKSNYSIEGFSSEVSHEEIVNVATKNNLIDYYDMGSGHMIDLPYNLNQTEPSVKEIMKVNPSLVSFSGDKLLGSVQAGIIVGKKKYIDKLKKNQLLRMLRVDKLTLAILEDNIISLLLDKKENIPTLNMLFTPITTLKSRASEVENKIQNICTCNIIETQTVIGGGTTPNKKIPTIALSIEFKNYKPSKIEKLFREKKVIGRIENDKFLLDFRSIQDSEIESITKIISEICNG
ncbi:MAG: L-seryl-tRNA(Sec) selenium transferase [Arcobacteraceae bacterium]|nr:L-seryl-tRNA(Sec) selenium transferase [Arcobacteraceae bacterium]